MWKTSPVPRRRDKTVLKAVPTIKGVHFFSSAHCLEQESVLLQQGSSPSAWLCIFWKGFTILLRANLSPATMLQREERMF